VIFQSKISKQGRLIPCISFSLWQHLQNLTTNDCPIKIWISFTALHLWKLHCLKKPNSIQSQLVDI